AWYKAWPSVGRSVQGAPDAQGKAVSVKLDLPEIDFTIEPELSPTTEQAALEQLESFVAERGADYQKNRDLPALEGTSRLSAALAVGLVSPVQCFHEAVAASDGDLSKSQGLETWVSELIWREFYINVIYCWPDVCKGKAFRPETDAVAWRYDEKDFALWCEGKTGFPIVDAAMRQLNETGWMHNRLRMVTAMFLTKYLLIDWRWGEQYFMSHLVDGHFAANNGGWQWSASTGTDAAPYFRLLSPIRQGERFDPDGDFIKRFIPELKDVSSKALHKPGCSELTETGYPAPMVDLKVAREACLAAFKALRD
ncbi:MAG: cryptochrome/photolyase family protein, partial [Pseudomonadales bacterium]